MKRIIAIAMIFTLGVTYTGVELCIDFCANHIEAIHFGADEEDGCHESKCCDKKQSCCESSHVELHQLLLDYVQSGVETISINQFTLPYTVTSETVSAPETHVIGSFSNDHNLPVPDLVQIQVFRC